MMIQGALRKVFGTQNDRELKSIRPLVDKINGMEPSFEELSDSDLQAKTNEYKTRFKGGETLDKLLPEAFAAFREASKRVTGMRPYDVQLIGGITLHRGRIAEMKTGEGKTLMSTLAGYLNALTGEGVHVVTVNDYLATRDTEWMGQVYRWMGLSVGTIVHGLSDRQRKESYACDITYGTNNEFGFDYLRDNMKFRLEDYVQRSLNFAIVDEVDSILIDEARTPLIISGPSEDSTDQYYVIDQKVREGGGFTPEVDYTVDEKGRTAALTDVGVEKMEKRLEIENLFDPTYIETLHHVNQALRAHVLFKKDVDYVVADNEVQIVDEFTGRLMPGRRWSDGLHQAIEAKEGVRIENENQTLATITFQNYFRMYNKLAGMTGTADTEATEFKEIYKLEVTVIPTNRPIIRLDHPDVVYKNVDEKFSQIVEAIKESHAKGQPSLVGTISVEKSELISRELKAANVAHNVLNAKMHEREADVVAQAGRRGAVTIATNMAGRGTDIVLGGNPEVLAKTEAGPPPSDANELIEWEASYKEAFQKWTEKCASEKKDVLEAGGLIILGTERHESRRIDNQLRGRAGRQGDPGASRFFLSLDDDLMRIFGGDRIKKWMEDGVPIEHGLISRAIENAQKKVEGRNYDIRKHLLQYDDVMNQQRKVIYSLRRDVLGAASSKDLLFSMVDEIADTITQDFFPNGRLPRNKDGAPALNVDELNDAIEVMFAIDARIEENQIEPFNDKGLRKLVIKIAEETYARKETEFGEENIREVERMILLTTIDNLWKGHLQAMDHMREGINLRGYAQKDPLVEYKKEGFRFFSMMMKEITSDVVRKIYAVQMSDQGPMDLHWDDENPGEMEYNTDASGDLVQNPNFAPGANALGGQPVEAGAPMGSPGPFAAPGGGLQPAGAGGGFKGQGGPMVQPIQSGMEKVGRNDPCPCGSGKKFKKCHGQGL